MSDVDRAKRFYEGLGWRLDADFTTVRTGGGADDTSRLAVLDPCSARAHDGRAGLGSGNVPRRRRHRGSTRRLIGHGVDVSEVFHFDGSLIGGRRDACRVRTREGRSYFSFASFSDPDGNGWLLQEVTTRLPGRGLSTGRRDADRASARNREASWRSTNRPLRSTTGRTGTPPTSSRASAGGLPTRRPRMPRSTSRRAPRHDRRKGSYAVRHRSGAYLP